MTDKNVTKYKGPILPRISAKVFTALGLIFCIGYLYSNEIIIIILGLIILLTGAVASWHFSIYYLLEDDTLRKKALFLKDKTWDMLNIKTLKNGTQRNVYALKIGFKDGTDFCITRTSNAHMKMAAKIHELYYPIVKKEFKRKINSGEDFDLEYTTRDKKRFLIVVNTIAIIFTIFVFISFKTVERYIFLPIIPICLYLIHSRKQRVNATGTIGFTINKPGIKKISDEPSKLYRWKQIKEVYAKLDGTIKLTFDDNNVFILGRGVYIGFETIQEYMNEQFQRLIKEKKLTFKSDFQNNTSPKKTNSTK